MKPKAATVLATFVSLLLLSERRAHADGAEFPEPVLQWGVQKGETCEDVSKAVYGSTRHAGLVTRYNAVTCTRGAPLKPGTTLVLPASVTEVPTARIRAMKPAVEARPSGGSWSAASPGMALATNASVHTLERGSADIQFLDRSRIFLANNTLVVVFGTAAQTSVRKDVPKVEVDQGEVRAMVSALRGPASIGTKGGGFVEAQSTETVIERKGERSTIAVFDGSARVTNAGRSVQVPKNFGTRFVGAKPPAPPRPLPPPPVLAEGSAPLVAFVSDEQAWTTSWKPADGAKAYRIEVALDKAFSELVLRQEAGPQVTSFAAKGLPAGRYFVRTRTIDKEDFLGVASETREATIVRLTVVAGSLAADKDGALKIDDNTVVELKAPPGVLVALDEDAFGEPPARIELGPGGAQSLRLSFEGRETKLALLYQDAPAVAPSLPRDTSRPPAAAPAPQKEKREIGLSWGGFSGSLGGPPTLLAPDIVGVVALSGGVSTRLTERDAAPAARAFGAVPLGPVALDLELGTEPAEDAESRSDVAAYGLAGVRGVFIDGEEGSFGASARFGFPASTDAGPLTGEASLLAGYRLDDFSFVGGAGTRLVVDGSSAIGFGSRLAYASLAATYDLLPVFRIFASIDGAGLGTRDGIAPDVGLSAGAEVGTTIFAGAAARVAPLESQQGQVSGALTIGARVR